MAVLFVLIINIIIYYSYFSDHASVGLHKENVVNTSMACVNLKTKIAC